MVKMNVLIIFLQILDRYFLIQTHQTILQVIVQQHMSLATGIDTDLKLH